MILSKQKSKITVVVLFKSFSDSGYLQVKIL